MRKVLPGNFFPKPKVDSAIVMVRPNPAKRAKVGNVKKFPHVPPGPVRPPAEEPAAIAETGHRAGSVRRPDVDAKLAELGIDGALRAEGA